MGRVSGRWTGMLVAVVVVGALAVYVAANGSGATPAARTAPQPAQTVPGFDGFDGSRNAPETAVTPAKGMSAGDLAGLIIKVGIVAAVMGGSLWLLRRYGGGTRAAGRTGAITVADTIPLAPNRAVYVLDVGDRALLIGATAQHLSYIADVTAADVLERLRTAPERPPIAVAGLPARLAAALQAGTSRTPRRTAERTAMAGTHAMPDAIDLGAAVDEPVAPVPAPRRGAGGHITAPTFAETFAGAWDAAGGVPDQAERLAALTARLRAMRGSEQA